MKFVTINGEQHIILEEADSVHLTTPDALGSESIIIKKGEDGISISGNASLISEISGKGMLEKVSIPPVLSSKTIIEKCDQWIEMFKQVHDKFRELALTEKYGQQEINVILSFTEFFSLKDSSVKGKSINLDMKRYNTLIQEGITISLNEENRDVYKYLLASTLAYYLSKNCADIQINLNDFDWGLRSSVKRSHGRVIPLFASLGSLCEASDYVSLVTGLIECHNVGASMDQIIDNYRMGIHNQQLPDGMIEGIEHSTRQYEYIIPTEVGHDKSLVLK